MDAILSAEVSSLTGAKAAFSIIREKLLDTDSDPGEEFFRAMRVTDQMRDELGYHHNGYHVALRARVLVDGEPHIVCTGNFKPEKGDGAVRICAEQFFLALMALLAKLGYNIVIDRIWLCAEPRPEKDANAHFGVRTPCDKCLGFIDASEVLNGDETWTLHTPCGDNGMPVAHITMETEALLAECLRHVKKPD